MTGGAERWAGVPAGLLTLGPDGTVVAANDTLLEWTGADAAELLGLARVDELFTVGGRMYWETHLWPLLLVEGRLDEVALELRTATGRVPVLLTARASGPAGHVQVVLVVARERVRFDRELLAAHAASERATTQVSALLAVTAALSGASGVAGVVQALRSAALEHLGAVGAEVTLAGPGRGAPRGAARATTAGAGLLDRLRGERRAVAVDDRVLVPAHGHSRLQAVLSLDLPRGPGAPAPDLALLTTVGQQAGLALDRARYNEQRSGIAHELQRSLLAGDPPHDPRFGVAATYRPGVEDLDVGGDWHDVFRADGSGLWFTVGDVVGRGLRAAIAMGQLRSAERALSGPGTGPADVLTGLDRFTDQFEDARCATVALAHLDLDSGQVLYACAGHLPPVLVRADGTASLLWDGRSTPLGVPVSRTGGGRREGTVALGVGDSVLLYTDGLVERRHRPLDGGLEALTTAAAETADLAPQEAVDHLTGRLLADEDFRDDVCLLMVTWRGPGARDR